MRSKALLLLLAGLLLLGLGAVAFADTPAASAADAAKPAPAATAPDKTTGVIGLTLETFTGDTRSAKFEEYREVPKGLYLSSLGVVTDMDGGRRRLTLTASKLALRDERIEAELEEFGRYSIALSYDRLPHLLSTTGRTIFQESRPGVFTLPTQVKIDLNALAAADPVDTTAFGNIIDGLERPVSLGVDRETFGLRGTYNPSPDLTFFTAFRNERRQGRMPVSATFVRTNQVELPAPVDYETQDFAIGAEYAARRGVARLQFDNNVFRDHNHDMVWDNPIQPTDGPLSDESSTPGRGRRPLAPDNSAQTLALDGAYRIADNLRFTGAVSRGVWRQDAAFVPMTINSVINANYPANVALPANSADAEIDVALEQFALNYEATRELSVTARYRRYELKNESPALEFPGSVVTDTEISTDPVETEPRSYRQQNTGLDFRWRPAGGGLNLRVTGEQEVWHRTHRDVDKTRENIGRASLDYQANDWLLLRLEARRGNRRIQGAYDTDEENPLLRRYDEADRDRTDYTALLQVVPVGPFAASVVLRRLTEDYPGTVLGLTRDRMRDISFDWDYEVNERTALFGGLGFNRVEWDQASRYETALPGNPLDDWFSVQIDHSQAFWLGVTHALRPDRLTLDAGVDYNIDRSKTHAFGTPGGSASGNATDWPEVTYRYFTPQVTANYQESEDRTWRFGYRYEKYAENDFQFDVMNPYMASVDSSTNTSVFLGARVPGYHAHIFTLEMQQRF